MHVQLCVKDSSNVTNKGHVNRSFSVVGQTTSKKEKKKLINNRTPEHFIGVDKQFVFTVINQQHDMETIKRVFKGYRWPWSTQEPS
jgi:hypothetical protein